MMGVAMDNVDLTAAPGVPASPAAAGRLTRQAEGGRCERGGGRQQTEPVV